MCDNPILNKIKEVYKKTHGVHPLECPDKLVDPSLEIRKNTFGEFILFEGETYSVCKKDGDMFYHYGPYANMP